MILNLSNRGNILKSGWVIFITALTINSSAQNPGYSKPVLTDKWDDYKKQVRQDSTKKMVELKSVIPDIVYDLRYATVNNFMRKTMYPAGTDVSFLRLPAVIALKKVQEELAGHGFSLKIYDAYRPHSTSVKFWELIKDERYVANPSRGSNHNRGTAVDLTLLDRKTNREINMGTGFDDFSEKAHHAYENLPDDVKNNRRLLKALMEKYGFRPYANEWWHYNWPGGNYEILDIDFKKLKKPL